MSEKGLELIIRNCSLKVVLFRISALFLWLLIVWDAVSVPLAIAAASHDQAAQDAHSFESSMRQHYDAAFRFQAAGDLAQAGMQYKLFLADALHELGNGRADIKEYVRALPLYEDAIGLASPEFSLYLDYARAALDGGDSSKARVLAQDALNLGARVRRRPRWQVPIWSSATHYGKQRHTVRPQISLRPLLRSTQVLKICTR